MGVRTARFDAYVTDLKSQIAEKHVVAVVGTGVAAATTSGSPIATWSGLLQSGVERAETWVPALPDEWGDRIRDEINSQEIENLLSAAEKITTRLNGTGGEYGRWLRETVGKLRVSNSAAIEALAALDVPLLTTNYDSLIEDVTGWRSITWRESREVEYWVRGQEGVVLHLHGHWKDPSSVILGIRDYSRILAEPHTRAILHALQTTKTFLFVGFGSGLADPNFTALLEWAREVFSQAEFRHYRLARSGEVNEVQASHRPSDRIYAIPYGKDYDELPAFLRGLKTRPNTLSVEVVRPQETVPDTSVEDASESGNSDGSRRDQSSASLERNRITELSGPQVPDPGPDHPALSVGQINEEPKFSPSSFDKSADEPQNGPGLPDIQIPPVTPKRNQVGVDDVPKDRPCESPSSDSSFENISEADIETDPSLAIRAFNEAMKAYNNKRYCTAVRLLETAAIAVNEAAYNLGMIYELGLGVASDPGKAVKWYNKAAAHGNAEAMNCLGLLYELGEFVDRSHSAAHVWYRKAADLNNQAAVRNLERFERCVAA